MKTYCHVCDRITDFFHTREHFNWEEFADPEEVRLAEERRINWLCFIRNRNV